MQIGGWVNQTIAIVLLVIAFLWSGATIIYWLRKRARKKRGQEPKTLKGELNLDLVKLFHEGKDIQAELERVQILSANAQVSGFISPLVSAEIHFEAWFANVTKTLENTDCKKLWYGNKVVNHEKDSLSDYIGASKRALDRLESILQLTSHKEGFQT